MLSSLHHDPQLAAHNPQLDHEAGNTSSLGEGAVIRIDGSMHSGSGTLLRYAATLATLTREPLHMVRIRAKRPKPGLRPQHLQALRSCCHLCSGRLEGDEVGSQEIFFVPGKRLPGGDYHWDIGTAGSATMLAFTVIPAALFADGPSRFFITGGVFQDFAPSGFHMQKVLIPLVREMAAHSKVEMEIVRPGYVPKGNGQLEVKVTPVSSPLKPLHMLDQGSIEAIRGISLASHLDREKVSRRMADECERLLKDKGCPVDIRVMDDGTSVQKGAALTLWAETDTGCRIGADQAGKPGRRSESIADFVVRSLLEDLATSATTDRHLADQLILFAALASGTTQYLIPGKTDHVESNLWLVNEVLGVRTDLNGATLAIEGIGFYPSG